MGTPQVSAPWHSGKCCKALWDMGTLWTDRLMEGQTRVKTLPSRRTTYAGGNNPSPKSEVEHETEFVLKISYLTSVWNGKASDLVMVSCSTTII